MEQENPGVSCTAKTVGKKSVFASNYDPLGAGVMFSTRQQLTKSDSYHNNSCWALNTKQL